MFCLRCRYLQARGHGKRHTVAMGNAEEVQDAQWKPRQRRSGLLTVMEKQPGTCGTAPAFSKGDQSLVWLAAGLVCRFTDKDSKRKACVTLDSALAGLNKSRVFHCTALPQIFLRICEELHLCRYKGESCVITEHLVYISTVSYIQKQQL